MALKPTKIKNSSQSGKMNIADELNAVIETQLPTVEETKAELQPVVAKAVTESLSEKLSKLSPDDFEAAVVPGYETELAETKASFMAVVDHVDDNEITRVNQKPILILKGKQIPLTELQPGYSPLVDVGRYVHDGKLILTSTQRSSTGGNWQDYQIASDFKPKWWSAVIDGTEFKLSSGSFIEIREGMENYGWDYDEITPRPGNTQKTLICLASKVQCNYLLVEGKAILNNSVIDAEQNVTLRGCVIACSNITAKYNTEVSYSRVTQSSFFNGNYTVIKDKSNIERMYLSGLSRVNLTAIRSYEDFRINTHGRYNSPTPSMDIKNMTLGQFDCYLGDVDEAIKIFTTGERRKFSEMVLNIQHRIDYGAFTGITPIPFIRVGDHDLLIAGELFTAEEFFGLAQQDTQPKPVDPTVYRSEDTSFRPNYGLGVIGGGSFYKGSLVWNRAAKVLYAYKHKNLVVGKSGESLINALVEQIKSRLGLYVEINNMGL